MNSTNNRRIGLCLDHSQAKFIDINKSIVIIETTLADETLYEHFEGEAAIGVRLGNKRATNSEHHRHNITRRIRADYFKLLVDRLKAYDDIYLFGPTEAKDELYNLLVADKHFANKAINVESCDKLTENQMVARVRKFFNL